MINRNIEPDFNHLLLPLSPVLKKFGSVAKAFFVAAVTGQADDGCPQQTRQRNRTHCEKDHSMQI